MKRKPDGLPGRRRMLRAAGVLPLSAIAGGVLIARSGLAATPECREGDEPTPRQTAGPFYKPDSPQRRSLVDSGMQGASLAIGGRVLSTDCKPIAGALLDFWHCDGSGRYDLRGYRFRGHQFADSEGRYRLQTLHPGNYPGRTRHLHVMVQAPNRPVLVTQLYFPGEPENADDFIFRPDLLMRMADGRLGGTASFDFVLDLG